MDRYYTDDWGAYGRHIDTKKYEVDKRNTQKIERKNLNLRTWIKRLTGKTICFSKSEKMHDITIGLAIWKHPFGMRPMIGKGYTSLPNPRPTKQHRFACCGALLSA
ncbi:MAG: hypothetical protein IBX55_06575 [Methyloprofundus sp.]|nr:hypothetical protein [Methyloprofundus sp.]MBW6454125.1 IS1 family transposase [Methyloprofundus sp.]